LAAQLHAINDCIDRSLPVLPLLISADMPKATMLLHTKPPTMAPPDTPPAST